MIVRLPIGIPYQLFGLYMRDLKLNDFSKFEEWLNDKSVIIEFEFKNISSKEVLFKNKIMNIEKIEIIK